MPAAWSTGSTISYTSKMQSSALSLVTLWPRFPAFEIMGLGVFRGDKHRHQVPTLDKDFQAVGQGKNLEPSDFLVLQVTTSTDGFVQYRTSFYRFYLVVIFFCCSYNNICQSWKSWKVQSSIMKKIAIIYHSIIQRNSLIWYGHISFNLLLILGRVSNLAELESVYSDSGG